MIKWALYKIDYLIHKVIPHPPCKKAHYASGGVITTSYPGFNANSTVNTGLTTVRYTNLP